MLYQEKSGRQCNDHFSAEIAVIWVKIEIFFIRKTFQSHYTGLQRGGFWNSLKL
jgi:hypothetical protein